MTELEKKITDAAQEYYTDGTSNLTDDEFDGLIEQLRKENPDSEVLKEVGWGYSVDKDTTPGKKYPHKYGRAGSLEKYRTWEEIHPEFKSGLIDVSLKIDGISVVLYYKQGELYKSLTRGDGIVGIDITNKIKSIKSVQNSSYASPNGKLHSDGIIPMYDKSDIENYAIVSRIKEYMKIIDGIIIQPGTWVDNSNKPPQKDFTPTLAECPRLRLGFSERIETTFYLLLTGFTNRSVVDGVTGFHSAVNTQSPADGDFLGPWTFPWSAKVIFSVPTAFVNYFINNNYERELKAGSERISVKSDAIIDLKQNHDDNNNSDYYENPEIDGRIPSNITKLNVTGDNVAILATYMHSSGKYKLPPALYAALINGTGKKYFEPVDTVAPGSLHLYRSDTIDDDKAKQMARSLENQVKGATAFLRNSSDYVIYELKQISENNFDRLPVSNDITKDIQSLKMSNMPYLWLLVNGEEEIKNVGSLVVNKYLHGTVSDKFIEDFCFDGTDIFAIRNGMQYSPGDKLYGLYTYIKNGNDPSRYNIFNCISEDEKGQEEYYYFLMSGERNPSANTFGMFFVPVNKSTKMVSAMLPNSINMIVNGKSYSIDFTNREEYLGSWFNASQDINNPKYGNGYGLSGHPLQKYAVTMEKAFYSPMALVPKPPSEYDCDFLKWFKKTSVTKMIPNNYFGEGKIHKDYKNTTIYEFLKYCCMYDLVYPMNDKHYLPERSLNLTYRRYIYEKSEINKLSASSNEFHSHTEIKSITTPQKFFYDADVEFRDADNSSFTNKTQDYIDSENAIWASVETSGHNSTQAISLIDNYGIPLPLMGNSEEVTVDRIIWNDLLRALNNNQSLDVLGDSLIQLKKSAKDVKKSGGDGDYVIHIDKDTGDTSLKKVTVPSVEDIKFDEIKNVPITISTSGWSNDNTAVYPYFYDLNVAGITANDIAEIVILPDSLNAAIDCGICPTNQTLTDKIRIRSAKIPVQQIMIEYNIHCGKE